mgnify:CR=1 FL=1
MFAEWQHTDPHRPTLLIYGHYDVQPPDPIEKWDSPPFEPTLLADRYVARGASDDKSPLWIAISGIEAWLAVTGALPLNVKVLLEGEEEIGSRSLPGLLETHRALLTADVLVSADGGRWRPGPARRRCRGGWGRASRGWVGGRSRGSTGASPPRSHWRRGPSQRRGRW